MRTTQIAKRLNELAEIGIVNAQEDTAVLREASERMIALLAKLCPKWDWWLIMDDGMFLESVDDAETCWTMDRDDALQFSPEDYRIGFAEQFLEGLDDEAELVMYGDYEGYPTEFVIKIRETEDGVDVRDDAGECGEQGVRDVSEAEDRDR